MEFLVHTKECLKYAGLSNKVSSISADLWNDAKKIEQCQVISTMSPQVTRGFELKDLSMYNLPIYFNSPHGILISQQPSISIFANLDLSKILPKPKSRRII